MLKDITATQPQNRRLGYTRVSTYGARPSVPGLISSAAGCTNQSIYREKVTGAEADRREVLRMLDHLAPATW